MELVADVVTVVAVRQAAVQLLLATAAVANPDQESQHTSDSWKCIWSKMIQPVLTRKLERAVSFFGGNGLAIRQRSVARSRSAHKMFAKSQSTYLEQGFLIGYLRARGVTRHSADLSRSSVMGVL